ncbi:MAG: M48 family metallopeptidase [Candidatus Magnetoovum sp. WYHC-5]|nr:M48 family metallopeptidase [Candidatus Magnetoovum sp. WYHC-5]
MLFALIMIVILYIVKEGFEYWVDYLNLKHMKGRAHEVPTEFIGHIDRELLAKTQQYVIENTTFGFISAIFNNIMLIIFIFGGLLNIFNLWIVSLNQSFIVSGLVFFIILSFIETVLGMPFDFYRTFKIESKFGFNTMTVKLWVIDLIKGLILSGIIMSIVISAALWLISVSHDWWLWLWLFFFLFSILIMYVSPYIIEPLFNKFTPIEEESLVGDIKNLMAKAGISVSKVFKMDASKRSKHTNAYFTGIGRTKRIVLFDTLLAKMNTSEILAVLAHEAGHWKKRHIIKRIVLYEVLSFIVLYVSHLVLESEVLPYIFMIEQSTFYTKFVLFGFVASIVVFPLAPIFNAYSQKHEREADRFACTITGDNKSLISSLIKLSKDNLSNLHPHPLYVKFHYSHPPVTERVRYISENFR